MSSTLTLGRALPVKDQIGGIKRIYFLNKDAATITFDGTDTDMIDSLGAVTVYEYKLKDSNASLSENFTSDPQAGTSFVEQSLEVKLTKLTKEDHKELKLLIWGDPHVIILDNNDNLFLMGKDNGVDTQIASGTGGAHGEMTGYTITCVAKEKTFANVMKATTGTSATAYPFDNLTGAVTVTSA